MLRLSFRNHETLIIIEADLYSSATMFQENLANIILSKIFEDKLVMVKFCDETL